MSEEHEMSELQEAAEHGREHSSLAPVSFTMAVLAVLVAVAALMSHRAHTEEILLQVKAAQTQDQATDEWGYYQAKNIRTNTMEQVDSLVAATQQKSPAAAELVKKNEAAIEKNRDDLKEIQEKAKGMEEQVKKYGEGVEVFEHRAGRFDLGETLLEVGLVICSITLLTKKRHFWIAGLAFGIAGIALAVMGMLSM